jgi:hypothetical protein
VDARLCAGHLVVWDDRGRVAITELSRGATRIVLR